MPKQEILPPMRTETRAPLVSVSIPTIYTGDAIDSYFDRKRYERDAHTVTALANLNKAEVACREAQTALVEKEMEHRRSVARLAELPEIIGHEVAIRRVQRADRFRDAQHAYEMNEMRRVDELTAFQVKTTETKAQLARALTLLTDAEQQLRAQQEHGYFTYEIAHKKKQLELLDIQLSEAERRAYMKGHLSEVETPDDEIYAILGELRQQLADGGLDTSRLDAVLARRKK